MSKPHRDLEEVEALVEENRKAFVRARGLLLAMKQGTQEEQEKPQAPNVASGSPNQVLSSARSPGGDCWLNLHDLAKVELASPENPADFSARVLSNSSPGIWRPKEPGPQNFRLVFDAPRRIRNIRLVFVEEELERTQEFVLRWLPERAGAYQEVVRQQYVFSPAGSTREVEVYQVDLRNLVALELSIVPDLSGKIAFASLSEWGLAEQNETSVSTG